jgi:hypothetical protein
MNRSRKITTGVVAAGILALTATGIAYAANPAPGLTAPITAAHRLVDVPGKAIGAGQTQTIAVAGQIGIPANATGVTGIISFFHGTGASSIVVWDGAAGAPGVPTIQSANKSSQAQGVFHTALTNGTIKVHNTGAASRYLISVTGYDVPLPAATPTTFGVAQFNVGTATWAQYSAPELGAPGGDQAGGAVRFTCRDAVNGCNVSLKAFSTASGWAIYPRIVLEKEDNTTGAKLTCEYADGTDNDGGTLALTATAATVPLGIGSTADCGGSQTGAQPASVDSINVPGSTGQGIHYDAFVTLTFARAGS